MDAIVASVHPVNTLNVYLGVPGGGMNPLPAYSTGAQTYYFVIAQLNGDGIPDVAMTRNGIEFAAALGNGNGTFAPLQTFGTGTFLGQVVVDDLNHDAIPDAVVAEGGAFSFYLGLGNGSFGPKTVVPVTGPTTAIGVATGDVNGDNHIDVFVTSLFGNPKNGLALYLGDGQGGFTQQWITTAFAGTSNPLTGDFNNDGSLDVVRGVPKLVQLPPVIPGFVEFRYQPLAANGGPVVSFGNPGSSNDLQRADVNSDGTPDVFLFDNVGAQQFPGSGCLTLLRSSAPGVFTQENYPIGTEPTGFTLADFTGDGLLDLLGADASNQTASILTGTPTGSFFHRSFPTGLVPMSVLTGDFDFDGRVDALVTNAGSATLSIIPGDGIGGFLPKSDFPLGVNPQPLVCADLNGDSMLDAIAINRSDTTFSVLLHAGAGFAPKVDYSTNSQPNSLTLGDLNVDGALDVALVSVGSGQQCVSVRLGDGAGGFGPHANFGLGTLFGPYDVAIGDLTSDGAADVVVTNNYGYFLSRFQGDGTGNLTTQTDYPIGPSGYSPTFVEISDLQLDGINDMVCFTTNGYVSPFLGDGFGGFVNVPEVPSGEFAKDAHCRDLNSDGFPDVVMAVQSLEGGHLTLAGDGTGSFGQLTKYPELVANGAGVGDLDADGDLDILLVTQLNGGRLIPIANKTPPPGGMGLVAGGTPGCRGPAGLRGSTAPVIGNADFLVFATNTPSNLLGLTLVTDQPNFFGSDPFGIGILLNVDFFASTVVLGLDAYPDPAGVSRTALPIVNNPQLAGAKFYIQNVYLGCALTPFTLSSSYLMEITLLP
jgi:hypothetical protein